MERLLYTPNGRWLPPAKSPNWSDGSRSDQRLLHHEVVVLAIDLSLFQNFINYGSVLSIYLLSMAWQSDSTDLWLMRGNTWLNHKIKLL